MTTNTPENLAARLAEVERQLRTLATAPRAGHTSLEEGVFEVLDADGDPRVRIGDLDDAGLFGVQIFDEAGGQRFGVDIDGMKDPYLVIPFARFDGLVTVDSGSFVTTHVARIPLVSHRGLTVGIDADVDPGVTMEIQLSIEGGPTSDVKTITGVEGFTFRWLHGLALGTVATTVNIQARVTAGAPNGYVFDPYGLAMVDPQICTAGGL